MLIGWVVSEQSHQPICTFPCQRCILLQAPRCDEQALGLLAIIEIRAHPADPLGQIAHVVLQVERQPGPLGHGHRNGFGPNAQRRFQQQDEHLGQLLGEQASLAPNGAVGQCHHQQNVVTTAQSKCQWRACLGASFKWLLWFFSPFGLDQVAEPVA